MSLRSYITVGQAHMPEGVHITTETIRDYVSSLNHGDVFQCWGLGVTASDPEMGYMVKWRVNKKYAHQCQLKLVRGNKVLYGYARYVDMFIHGEKLQIIARQEERIDSAWKIPV